MEKLIPCKACGKEISKEAKTCPNCGAKNNRFSLWQAILAIFLLFIIYGAFTSIKTTPTVTTNSTVTRSEETSKPALEVLQTRSISDSYSRYIVGKVRNNTDRTYSYVQVSFNLYDNSGAQVGSTLDNINNLEPNGIWKFKAIIIGDNVASFKFKDVSGW